MLKFRTSGVNRADFGSMGPSPILSRGVSPPTAWTASLLRLGRFVGGSGRNKQPESPAANSERAITRSPLGQALLDGRVFSAY